MPIAGTSDAVPEALQDIKAGKGIVATTSTDAYWDGSIGLAMGYCAATGKLDPTTLSHDKRDFYGQEFVVTKANVDKYLATPNPADYTQDWSCGHLFDRFAGPVT